MTWSKGALLLVIVAMASCTSNPVPKPKGYFRIDLPEKNYARYEAPCDISFELPAYAKMEILPTNSTDSCWFNMALPRQNAKIHFTYLALHNNLDHYLEDSYGFAFSHEMKANAINRTVYTNPERKVSGMIYDIKGDVASNIQFYATDSSSHFLRGALYFNVRPNQDSLAPVIDFVRDDVVQIMETLTW